MRIFGPYYYGKHKWDNYLLDIQQTLESGNAAHRQNIRLQSGTLDVARKQVEELRQQSSLATLSRRSRTDSKDCAPNSSGDSP